MRRYVVLDTPLPRIDGYDFITLEMMRRTAAAETLTKRGLVNCMSDTASGNPGMGACQIYGKLPRQKRCEIEGVIGMNSRDGCRSH
jgi:hypothetical protein